MYGFDYNCIGQYMIVQRLAAQMRPFLHIFDLRPDQLPEITFVDQDVLVECLRTLPELEDFIFDTPMYADTNPVLGSGTTAQELKYGAQSIGQNLFGKAMGRMVRERRLK